MEYPVSEAQLDSHRPKPFFFINTCDMAQLTPQKVEESLTSLKECGFGGFVLFNKPPVGFTNEKYLSEDWFQMVRNFAVAAKKLKLQMWVNDGYDYPPGNVGGKVEKIAPYLKQKHISLDRNGNVTVKEADWGFPAFEHPLSGQLFTQLVHDEYEKHVGEFFGDPIVGFFSDGDNRRVLPPSMFDEAHPCRNYFPWTDDFEESFLNEYGYNIMDYMVQVLNREDIPQAADYWRHAGHMYQRWFKNNRDWLKKRGLLYTGHTSDSSPFLYENSPRSSAFTEGRFSDIQSIFDYPGTDQELLAIDGGKHMSPKHWYSPEAVWGESITLKMRDYYLVKYDTRAKQAGSTAYLYDKKEVMCEMFAASNFGVSPRELKEIAAYQIMQGVTMVVPHAYHYRFGGPIKYFAPPEFSDRGLIGHSIKELNLELAQITAMLSEGESICPVALLDPTEAIWRNNFNEEEYFTAFSELNRSPYGFVIADITNILKKDFTAVVVAGFTPEKTVLQALNEKGIQVVYACQIEKLKTIVSCGVSYQGSGTPHFVRKNINGEEFTFVANIENEGYIEGIISAYGREEHVRLYSGDIIYISKNYDNIPKTVKGTYVCDLPQSAAVTFMDENIIPLERFTDRESNVMVKSDECDELFFVFSCNDKLDNVRLYVPVNDNGVTCDISIDGTALNSEKTWVYDDSYLVYLLPALCQGVHQLLIKKNGRYNSYDRIFLKGDFDVLVTTAGKGVKTAFSLYNINVSVPEKAGISLRRRRTQLSLKSSWAKQGQPFYSGAAEYSFKVEFAQSGEYCLKMPAVRDVATVSVNGKLVAKKIKPPYEFCFFAEKGAHNITISVVNSLGNAFECYLEESGILSGGTIEKI